MNSKKVRFMVSTVRTVGV